MCHEKLKIFCDMPTYTPSDYSYFVLISNLHPDRTKQIHLPNLSGLVFEDIHSVLEVKDITVQARVSSPQI